MSNLTAGEGYRYAVYQYATNKGGDNPLKVHGQLVAVTSTRTDYQPSFEGWAVANGDGELQFEFVRQSTHLVLSAITICGPSVGACATSDGSVVSSDACTCGEDVCAAGQYCDASQVSGSECTSRLGMIIVMSETTR